MLCAKADGTKLKPFVLLNRVRPMKELEKFRSSLEICYAGKIWMDDNLISQFLNKLIGPAWFTRRWLMVWDSFRAHISDATKAECKKLKLDTAVIPGGCTKYIQAPDVSWNKPFKAKICEQYDAWMSSGAQEYTRFGNMRAPSLELVCTWIKEAWSSISSDVIEASFKSCGISVALDRSEDDLITCFKTGSQCEDGRKLLQERMEKEDFECDIEEIGSFDGMEDKESSDDDELESSSD